MKLEGKEDGPVMEWAWVSDALRERALLLVMETAHGMRMFGHGLKPGRDDAIALEALVAYGRAARRPEPEAPRTYDAAPKGGDRYRREDVIFVVTTHGVGGYGLTSKDGPGVVATAEALAAAPWERLHTKADAIYHCRHCDARMPTATPCPGRLAAPPALGPEACGFCVTGNKAICYRHGPTKVREQAQAVRVEAEWSDMPADPHGIHRANAAMYGEPVQAEIATVDALAPLLAPAGEGDR